MAFKLGMMVSLCMVYIIYIYTCIMLVSMTLTQGDSGSADDTISLNYLDNKASNKHGTWYNAMPFLTRP